MPPSHSATTPMRLILVNANLKDNNLKSLNNCKQFLCLNILFYTVKILFIGCKYFFKEIPDRDVFLLKSMVFVLVLYVKTFCKIY